MVARAGREGWWLLAPALLLLTLAFVGPLIWFFIRALTEGRNRIVRRWVEEMGGEVERLARVEYGPVKLGDLAPGEYRPLTPPEERGLYKAIGMNKENGK